MQNRLLSQLCVRHPNLSGLAKLASGEVFNFHGQFDTRKVIQFAELDSVVMAVSRSSLDENIKSLKEVDIAPCEVQWNGRMLAACSSFGELWIGKWQGQLVALKKIKGRNDAAAEAKLRKEARMMMKLASPHIVRVHGFLSKPPAIVMQLMRCSLGALLRSSRALLSWRIKVGYTKNVYHLVSHICQIRITIQIITGLQFIHSQGVLHRDLKTDNVLLDCSGLLLLHPLPVAAANIDIFRTGTPFLSDFGHAENGRRASNLNASLGFEGCGRAGSLLWLAPEILAGACS